MTEQEIACAIAAGAEKRAARQAKREAAMREMEANRKQTEEIDNLPVDFEKRLKSTWDYMEHVYYKHVQMTPEVAEEAKALFFPDADDEFRFKVYQKFFHDYETLIFYAWVTSDELCDAAFKFWDNVLKNPNAVFSGNSVIRVLAGRPNQNLLKIFKNHREKFFGEGNIFRIILCDIIERYLREPGLWNFETKSYDEWNEEERRILEQIHDLF